MKQEIQLKLKLFNGGPHLDLPFLNFLTLHHMFPPIQTNVMFHWINAHFFVFLCTSSTVEQ